MKTKLFLLAVVAISTFASCSQVETVEPTIDSSFYNVGSVTESRDFVVEKPTERSLVEPLCVDCELTTK